MKFAKGVFEIGVCRQTLVARFKIQGNLRFLSHQETSRLIRRSLIRAGIELRYSEGFNPQPKLSLPLPRSVAVAADDEMFCVSILCPDDEEDQYICEQLKSAISGQLPVGCELRSVETFAGKVSPKAVSARYQFPVRRDLMDETLRNSVECLNEKITKAEPVVIDRKIDGKGRTRQVDVCGFIKSVYLDSNALSVECSISNAGTIRPTEILTLLELNYSALTGPIERNSVQWVMN